MIGSIVKLLTEQEKWKDAIAVDFDGTLSTHDTNKPYDPEELGDPIKLMVDRVKKWLEDGESVEIFTARADNPKSIEAIKKWCKKNIGQELTVTNIKKPYFKEYWDDRAIRVEKDKGEIC